MPSYEVLQRIHNERAELRLQTLILLDRVAVRASAAGVELDVDMLEHVILFAQAVAQHLEFVATVDAAAVGAEPCVDCGRPLVDHASCPCTPYAAAR